MIILGCDQASNFAFSIFEVNDNDIQLKSYGYGEFSNYSGVEKRNKIKQTFIDIINKYNPDYIILENIHLQIESKTTNGKSYVNAKVLSYTELSKILGLLEDVAYEMGIECFLIHPSTWRSKLGINKGRGVKREILKKRAMDYVNRIFDITGEIDDIAEAICIGHLGAISYSKISNK